MEIYKTKLIVKTAFCALVVVSCGKNSSVEMVPKTEYDAKIEEYKELYAQQTAIVDDNIRQNKIITNVVSELRKLTSHTTNLRMNIESGQAEVGHADEIQTRLNELKKLLTNIPKGENNNNKDVLATIENLHLLINEKEKEIKLLKIQIEEQNKTIQNQSLTIEAQKDKLEKKEKESWYTLGEELFMVSTELPKVRGRKDKRNIKNAKFYILNKAKECMDRAHELGHPNANAKSKEIAKIMDEL